MPEWPPISEPELLDRLAMDDREFEQFIWGLIAQLPARKYDATLLELALGYPWARPPGSYLLADGEVQLLTDLPEGERELLLEQLAPGESGRLPVLSIGSNAAPEVLERKFAHFDAEEDRAVLALTGHLHDFDVGAAAQPTLYGAMPATLFPSPGTAVSATVVWVTPNQFTQLTWTELSYRLGRLRTRFDVDEVPAGFEEVLVFVSRFGAFCVGGRPVALEAVPAAGRTAEPLTQGQLLDAAAALAFGPGAKAEVLVRAIFEDMNAVAPQIAATVNKSSQPFTSERWAPFGS